MSVLKNRGGSPSTPSWAPSKRERNHCDSGAACFIALSSSVESQFHRDSQAPVGTNLSTWTVGVGDGVDAGFRRPIGLITARPAVSAAATAIALSAAREKRTVRL